MPLTCAGFFVSPITSLIDLAMFVRSISGLIVFDSLFAATKQVHVPNETSSSGSKGIVGRGGGEEQSIVCNHHFTDESKNH
jgi:hypothetical protein